MMFYPVALLVVIASLVSADESFSTFVRKSFKIASHANSEGVTAIPNSQNSGSSYFQYVGYNKGGGWCETEPVEGFSYALNTCFYASEFSTNGTNVMPIYAYAFANTIGSVNMSFYNSTGCVGAPIDNVVVGLSTPGCTKADYGANMPLQYVNSRINTYPYWPTGSGYSINVATSAANCKAAPITAPVVSQYFGYFGACVNVTTNFATGKAAYLQFAVRSCSSSGVVLDAYASGSGCTGTPINANVKVPTGASCDSVTNVHGLAIGNAGFTCHASMKPKHNKCFNAVGQSSPPCELSMTKHALKWTCPDKSYSTCSVTGLGGKGNNEDAQAFACCV